MKPRRYGISTPGKSWNHPRKVQARSETIIHAVHCVHGKSIPKDGQYYTLCGRSVGPNTEFDQIIKAGIATPNQFYGIEINPDIYEENISVDTGAHFINEDFYDALVERSNAGDFVPAVVNFDTTSMPKKAAKSFVDILLLLTEIEITFPILYLVNVVLSCYNRRDTIENFINRISNEPGFGPSYESWSFSGHYYEYQGTGDKSTTKMGTIAMVRS